MERMRHLRRVVADGFGDGLKCPFGMPSTNGNTLARHRLLTAGRWKTGPWRKHGHSVEGSIVGVVHFVASFPKLVWIEARELVESISHMVRVRRRKGDGGGSRSLVTGNHSLPIFERHGAIVEERSIDGVWPRPVRSLNHDHVDDVIAPVVLGDFRETRDQGSQRTSSARHPVSPSCDRRERFERLDSHAFELEGVEQGSFGAEPGVAILLIDLGDQATVDAPSLFGRQDRDGQILPAGNTLPNLGKRIGQRLDHGCGWSGCYRWRSCACRRLSPSHLGRACWSWSLAIVRSTISRLGWWLWWSLLKFSSLATGQDEIAITST